MHSQFFLQKSCYWNKISHFLSIYMCWIRILRIMTIKL